MNPDLRDFLQILKHHGRDQLVHLDSSADARYELTALALELERTGGGEGPALYCPTVGDSSLPVVTNAAAGAMLDPSSEDGLTAKMGMDATRALRGWKAQRCTLPADAVAAARQRIAAITNADTQR